MIPRPAFVSFDVADDRRRSLLTAALRRQGDWHQRSLWIALPSDPSILEELGELGDHVLTEEDRLIVHRPCRSCLAEVRWEQPISREQLSQGAARATVPRREGR